MPELSLRQLQARLEDLEEQHAKDVAELRDLRREGAPAAKIEQAAEKVERTETKVETAEERIEAAKQTLRDEGYIIDDDPDPVAETGNKPEGAPETGDGESPESSTGRKPPAQEPPKEPKPAKPEPDAEPVGAVHWYDKEV